MYITLKAGLIRQLLNTDIKAIIEARMDSWELRRLKGERENDKVEDSETFQFNLPDFKKPDLKKLQDGLSKIPGVFPQTIATIGKWIEALDNPSNAEVTSLPNMEKVFRELYKQLPNKWLVKKNSDGTLNPVLVTQAKYKAGSRDSSATFFLSLAYGYYFQKDKDKAERFFTETETVYFYKGVTEEWDDDGIEFGNDWEEDDDDDDDW